MADDLCHYCGKRQLRDCREPVDERFPAKAREAFAAAGFTDAAICAEGQRHDMVRVGWCLDRAVASREWSPAAGVPSGVSAKLLANRGDRRGGPKRFGYPDGDR